VKIRWGRNNSGEKPAEKTNEKKLVPTFNSLSTVGKGAGEQRKNLGGKKGTEKGSTRTFRGK